VDCRGEPRRSAIICYPAFDICQRLKDIGTRPARRLPEAPPPQSPPGPFPRPLRGLERPPGT
jgi:hypothetical protein